MKEQSLIPSLCQDSNLLTVHLPEGMGVMPPIVLRHGEYGLVIISERTKTGLNLVKTCSIDVSKMLRSSTKYTRHFSMKEEAITGRTHTD